MSVYSKLDVHSASACIQGLSINVFLSLCVFVCVCVANVSGWVCRDIHVLQPVNRYQFCLLQFFKHLLETFARQGILFCSGL